MVSQSPSTDDPRMDDEGYLITDRMFLEATYHYTGKVGGQDTSSTSLCLGYGSRRRTSRACSSP